MIVVIWIVVLVAAMVLYFRRTYTLFSRQGVKQFSPLPIMGDMARVTLKLEHFADQIDRMYNTFPEERFVGRYEFTNPMVVVRDIELLKKITVKDFEHFLDHRVLIDEKLDPLFGRNLFSLKGQEWKDMRSTLSPAFTSSKIKLMIPFMVEVGEQMIQALKKKVVNSGVGYIDLDCKDLTTRYANDVVASCAFGLKVDSMTHEQNDFYTMGKAASTFNFKQMLKFFGFSAFPKMMKVLKMTLFTDDVKFFFRDIVTNTMSDREAKHIIRPDMINILMEAKKGKLCHEEKTTKDVDAGFATVEESVVGKKEVNREWSDDDLIAQAVLFFIAGFETVSSAMSFLLHEVAVNPDVQERLYQEIMENEEKNGGKFDYNSIQHMEYMDMVVSEVLRLWSPGIALDRYCIKDYNMGKPNPKAEKDFIVRKGMGIAIPLWGIHRDPNYFPNPTKFDPERFSEQNKHNIKPFTYLPFGLGPRNCIVTMIVMMCIVVTVAASVLYFRRTYTLFSRQGVKQFSPLPILGDMARITLKLEHFVDQMDRMYNTFPEERFVGRYEFTNPIVVVRDIELLKKITVKDFEHFLDHRMLTDEEVDPLFGRNLFSLKGQEWKDMRSTLSPAFTSSKVKLMVPFMVKIGEQMIEALKKKVVNSAVGYIDLDCKDLTTRYANDVVASCAFGLKVDSMTHEQNDFYKMGKAASTFNFKQMLKFFGYSAFPKLMKVLKITLFTENVKFYFRNIIMNTMNDREAKHTSRPDMINILLEAKKGKISHEEKSTKDVDAGFATVEESVIGKKEINREWSDDDLIAQAILFFIAGFETVSSAMTFLLYEVAVNPYVQVRLYQEIMENEERNGGKFDYRSIQHMEYMDMVVSEVLRLWSPGIALDRFCTKDYNLGKPNPKAEKDFIIRKGMGIAIPLWGIHRDPNYFPNPTKFDPERFSEQNKHNIKPFTYLPFGIGPRNCVGSRFALSEVKVMAYQLLRHMEISSCEKTCIPVKLDRNNFNIRIEGGHWIRMRVRQ